MPLPILKKRAEFLRIRGGNRFATPAFVLETKPRPRVANAAGGETGTKVAKISATGESGARFGFTVTKKMGGAVVRNRIRRRLKAAFEAVGLQMAKSDSDYVIVARKAAFDRPFNLLLEDARRAMREVHMGGKGRNGRQQPRKPAKA